MARKSRKETAGLPAPEIDTTCRAGVYVRLSVEDKHTRTASIETQQLIIARYLEQNPEIIVVQTYIDNGATGTNFHRPGFQQMLSDIEAGLINCVIVKRSFPPGAECHRHWLLYRAVFSHTGSSIYRCKRPL